MRRSRWRGHRTGFGVFLLGTGMGMITNLVTSDVERWPAALQPIATYAPGIGAGLLIAVGAKALWDLRRGGVSRPVWAGSNPYPGLVAYDERWAGVFFGRGPEVHELLARVRDARTVAGRFVPVVGPSGSGKSSVVLAGLLPALGDGWRVPPAFTPGTNAVGELAGVLGVDLAEPARAVLDAARAGEPAPRLGSVLAALHGLRAGARWLLLVVDQLEEAVTLGVEEDRHAFLALLEALLGQEPRLRVVATVRSDTVGAFQQGPGCGLFRDPLMINVMGPREIGVVVREPARLTGTSFDDGLIDEIIRDAGGGDALPLLSYLLSDLYGNVGRERHISWRDYGDSGGVSGAIARRAGAAVREVGSDALEPCLDTLLLFVTIGPGGATRQRVLGSTLDDRQRAVVQAFVEARLLVSDDAGGATEVVYDVAHEALLRQWEPLAHHIARHEESLRRLTELAPMARAWLRSGRQTDYLITGARLADALSWAGGAGRVIAPDVREFLDESQRNQAGEMERRANRVAREALASLQTAPEVAYALARAAYTELAPTRLAAYALEMSLASGLIRVLPHPRGVSAVAFGADGRLATGGDGVVRVWPPVGEPVHALAGHADGAVAIAFGPAGKLATADREGTVRVWLADGSLAHTWERVSRSPVRLAYTVHGHLAVAHGEGVLVVDEGLRPVRGLSGGTGHGGQTAVAAAPDGRVAAGCEDGTVLLWDGDGRLSHRLPAHRDCVFAVAFGPDGTLASGSRNGSVAVWDGSERLARWRAWRDQPMNTLAFGPGGSLAGGDASGLVEIWSASGEVVHLLADSGAPVNALAYAADGRLAAACADTTVRIWDLGSRLAETVADKYTQALAFTPDGRLATASTSGGIVLRSARAAAPPTVLSASDMGSVRALAVAADGRIVSGHRDGVRLWEPGAIEPVRQTTDTAVTAVAFLHNGQPVFGGDDGSVWRWDVSGPAQLLAEGQSVRTLACTPDHTVAVLRGETLRWVGSGGPPEWNDVATLAMTAGGRWAVGRIDGRIEIWDGPDGPPRLLGRHTGRPAAAAFAPDGRLATATSDGEVYVWDTDLGLLHTLRHTHARAGRVALAFAPDGRLAVGGGDLLRVWPYGTPDDELATLAARHARPPLTPQQRETAMLGRTRDGSA